MATTNLEAPAPFHIETGPVDLKAIGSIHTQQDRMGSVTYRTTVATIAMNATDAVAGIARHYQPTTRRSSPFSAIAALRAGYRTTWTESSRTA